MRTQEQFDGSVWRQYESPDALFLLTEVGRKLLAQQQVARLLRHYTLDYQDGLEGPEDARRFIAEGLQARVFGLGVAELAIKEKRPDGDDLHASLYRMDKLIHALTVDSGCPAWIGIPQHYGVVTLKEDTSRQFLLMEKIDEGITVGDILDQRRAKQKRPYLNTAVERVYGAVTDELQEEVIGRFGMALGELRHALLAKYLSPDKFIPDIDKNPYNILVQPLDEPLDGSNLKFWVIDQ